MPGENDRNVSQKNNARIFVEVRFSSDRYEKEDVDGLVWFGLVYFFNSLQTPHGLFNTEIWY